MRSIGVVQLVLLLWMGLGVTAPAEASVAPLGTGQSWYPRVIRLQHADATHNGRVLAATHAGTQLWHLDTNA